MRSTGSEKFNEERKETTKMKRVIHTITTAAKALGSSSLLLAMLAAPMAMRAQSVTLFGALGNFDVLNDTGQDAPGFEIELDGITPAQAFHTFNATPYGMGVVS